ncbi:hypothetical protein BTW15_01545 [Pseudomonas syringae pv. tomato]|uniref:Uncharacterized protein n=1 Tax=Pseudomonas syringae pv. tomato TaxID=323 RepID=A0AB36L010_PSEUB|nr:hypothetical protein [Pseudomonas syringae group genomosp. 3]KPB83869.1 Uncharacterized protein AC505_0471 [Pseudomonas syringae pv. maculicola]MBX6510528.1 hypothetical protein [Pseudomonas syringae pv. tomato]OPE62054.1 hypothetical protein BTW15_01545 [Pseudomonas syringae pv. tomato]RMV03454.1 hypothetical protein ALP19_03036 [Pseudomonas syringae pv. tomato]TES58933.1 hypothetical protein E2N91_11875 [Pseudomonas syringae pv. tomato]
MKRFVIVIHGWHVHSNGFDVHQVDCDDMQRAEQIATYLTSQREQTFDRCAWTVVEIEPDTKVVRALTWRERFTRRRNTPQ